MRKFNRNFRLLVENDKKKTLEIKSPFTVEFDVNRTIGSDVNKIDLKIYNLNKKTRESIGRDKFDQFDGGNGTLYRQLAFQAGYADLFTLFQGNVQECISYRNKNEIITSISAYDGGWSKQNSYSSFTLSAGASLKEAVTRLLKDLKKISFGEVDISETETFKTATTFDGNTVDLLNLYTNGSFFIDNETGNIIPRNSSLKAKALKVSSDSGLLSTPKLSNRFLEIEIILEPSVKIGQLIQLESSIRSEFNGLYVVKGIRHSGIISPQKSGDAKTTLQLFFDNLLFKKLQR